jgi:predicted 3-demethylubiquinone-9 3-methyltransferase (glyoxalase superfamily)
MPAMSTCLWFSGQAEEAVDFYLSIFKDGKVKGVSHYVEEAAHAHGHEVGSVLAIWFEILGRKFIAMNAKPTAQFNESVSFMVECDTQAEIDYYWKRLTAGGEEIQCGWLKDKFGVTWQVTPTVMGEMVCDPDPVKVARVMAAFGPMVKIDLAEVEKAYRGE